ncbi:DUF2809 domain-containing protein [Pedobacter sp. AW31-3R]|uniref:ribosomal maturation YjgA family protein n=1 Tax=Pedobacter sp. AW31-3R TaxID=3445781 RepID=UPI003FA07A27
MFQFKKTYLGIALVLFITEILIALFAHDDFIRPYAGDYLVVIFLYTLLKGCLNIRILPAALGVLLFSYLIETAQYFHLVEYLGLSKSKIALVVLGNYFAWMDILAYTLGILSVLTAEHLFHEKLAFSVDQQ